MVHGTRTSIRLKDRTGARAQLAGLGALLLVVALAALDPGSTSSAVAAGVVEPEAALGGLRQANRFSTTFEPYPGSELRPIGLLHANGNDLELHYFQTRDEPRRVLEYFGEQFARRGAHVDYQDREGLGAVSFYDADYGALVSVSTMRQASGETLAFPSVVHVPDGMVLAATAPEWLPAPEGVVTVARIEDRNLGRAAGSISVSQMAPGSPEELAAFYREQMAARGWREGERRTERDIYFLGFQKGDEQAMLTITQLGHGSQSPESMVMTVVEKSP
jgi:hypothetical protein